jgi:hypothetical protein
MATTLWVAGVGVFLASLVLSELSALMQRKAPDHPMDWLVTLAQVLIVLVAWYMVDGFGAYGSEGWLRWDHGVILFLVAIVPGAVGELWRWARK